MIPGLKGVLSPALLREEVDILHCQLLQLFFLLICGFQYSLIVPGTSFLHKALVRKRVR